jgi:hypothetical protein
MPQDKIFQYDNNRKHTAALPNETLAADKQNSAFEVA